MEGILFVTFLFLLMFSAAPIAAYFERTYDNYDD